jgi:predicted nucleotidyltransferase
MTNDLGQSTNMIGQNSLTQLFASETLVALLSILLTRPEESFYQRELVEATGARLYLVQRELRRLERSGIVTRAPRGNRVYYRANRGHPAFDDLKRAFLKTIALGDALRAALAPLAHQVRAAFIYGSYAAGHESAQSDIDLFLIGDLSSREAAAILGPIGRGLGRELNTVVYPPAEFSRKVREQEHFVTELLRGPKLFLIGDEHELAELLR